MDNQKIHHKCSASLSLGEKAFKGLGNNIQFTQSKQMYQLVSCIQFMLYINNQFQMSIQKEFHIRKLIDEICFYVHNINKNDSYEKLSMKSVDELDDFFKNDLQGTFFAYSNETKILFIEIVLKVKEKLKVAEKYLDYFFKANVGTNQYYLRALLAKATNISLQIKEKNLKAEEAVEKAREAIQQVFSAIAIIATPENKQKYSFLIYNASLCVYNIIRPFFRKDWLKNFTDIVEKLDALMDEINEPDVDWKTRFSWLLFNCLYEYDNKKAEAFKLFDKFWENTKKKGKTTFQESLLRMRIHFGKENPSLLASIKKECESAPPVEGLRHLLTLQLIKSGITPEAQRENEIVAVVNLINPSILTGSQKISLSDKITPVFQERLAETGRVAVSNGVYGVAEILINILSKIRQLNQKAYIWLEFTKAELLVKKEGEIMDPKTSMRMNPAKLKLQEIDRRVEALRIMEKVMGTCQRLNDPFLIYEGSAIIWNLSLPFLNENYKQYIYKPFTIACSLLESIKCTDVVLRSNLHYELAKIEIQEDFLTKAENHLTKALMLDTSIPLAKLKDKPAEKDDPALFQRVYDKYYLNLREKLQLKTNLYGGDTQKDLDKIMLEIENAASSDSMSYRLQVIQKNLSALLQYDKDKLEYMIDPAENLVPEEIERKKKEHKWACLVEYKKKKLIAVDVAKYALEWEFTDLVLKLSDFIECDSWNPKTEAEMVQSQIEFFFYSAQAQIDLLMKDGYEIAFIDPVFIDDEDNEKKSSLLTETEKANVLKRKKKIAEYFTRALRLGESLNQSWFAFNGAILIWNNFLSTFRNPTNDSKILPEIVTMLKDYFESIKNSIKTLDNKAYRDYDMENKMLVYSNIGIIYSRIMEGKSQYDEALKVAEALLLSRISPHTRKLVNSMKARVNGVSKGGNKPAPGGGAKSSMQNQSGSIAQNEQVLFDVVSQLEIIQNNTNKSLSQELIKKCFDSLSSWKQKENDETDLELHAELWTRLCRLALNEDGSQILLKYSIRCAENALELIKGIQDIELSKIPANRLRWYSLAEFLYAEVLEKLVNADKQSKDCQDQLHINASKHSLEAAGKGCKANISGLVLDAAKQFWNIILKIKDSVNNRKDFVEPVFTMLYYLKAVKESSEPDLLLFLYNFLLKCCLETEKYQLGEQAADIIVDLIPKPLQKSVWEGKMICLSKQGKNEMVAMSSMKDTSDPSLQAKIWIKIARNSNIISKQHSAYTSAIDILKRENSVEIVEVLIEFSEWLLKQNHDDRTVKQNLNLAVDILLEKEIDDEEDGAGDDDSNSQPTIFSRSMRSKKSFFARSQSNQRSKNVRSSTRNIEKASSKVSAKHESTSNHRSIRGTKTVKTKQSKSIFSEKREEPNPEVLNCSHFEKLIRLHGMMSLIAPTIEESIQMALDAKLFFIKMMELSNFTLNTLKQNAKKLNLSESNIEFYEIPKTLQEWIKYEFPADNIKNLTEDMNIISNEIFEKPWMTFYYMLHCVDILESHSVLNQALPLLIFLRFFTTNIAKDQYVSAFIEIRLAMLLYQLNFIPEADLLLKESKEKLIIDPAKCLHLKEELARIYVESTTENRYLLKKPYPHIMWISCARLFIEFGEVHFALKLLESAEGHINITKEMDERAKHELYKGICYFYEGVEDKALIHFMQSHKFITKCNLWSECIIWTVRGLLKLNKKEDAKSFISNVTEKFLLLTKEQNYVTNMSNLRMVINNCYTAKALYFLYLFKKKPSESKLNDIIQSVSNLCINQEQTLINKTTHYIILKIEKTLIKHFTFQKQVNFEDVFRYTETIQKIIKNHEDITNNRKKTLKYRYVYPHYLGINKGLATKIEFEDKLNQIKMLQLLGEFNLLLKEGKFKGKPSNYGSTSELSSNQLSKINISSLNSTELDKYIKELEKQIELSALDSKKATSELNKCQIILAGLESVAKINKSDMYSRILLEKLKNMKLLNLEKLILCKLQDPNNINYRIETKPDELAIVKDFIDNFNDHIKYFNQCINGWGYVDLQLLQEEILERIVEKNEIQAVLKIASLNHFNKLHMLSSTLKTFTSFKIGKLVSSIVQYANILFHYQNSFLIKHYQKFFSQNIMHPSFSLEDLQLLQENKKSVLVLALNHSMTILYFGLIWSKLSENETHCVIGKKINLDKNFIPQIEQINQKSIELKKLSNQRMLSDLDKKNQIETLKTQSEELTQKGMDIFENLLECHLKYVRDKIEAIDTQNEVAKNDPKQKAKEVKKPPMKGKIDPGAIQEDSLSIINDSIFDNILFENLFKPKKGFVVNREFSVIGLISELKQKEGVQPESYEYTSELDEENNSIEMIRKLKKMSDLRDVIAKTNELEQKYIHQFKHSMVVYLQKYNKTWQLQFEYTIE